MYVSDRAEVTIDGIGTGGVGVATLASGKVVFVPRTAPGDRVLAEIVKEKPRWALAEARRILEAGPRRRLPPCPLYSRCGGCSLQHLEYGEQLVWKGRIVGEALRRLGGLEVEDPSVSPSPREFGYRNRVTFTLRRLRGGRVVAGLRERTKESRVLDVGGDCLLPEEPLMETWQALREGWGAGASCLPGGRELRLTLRAGEEGVGLAIRGGHGDGKPHDLLSEIPALVALWREEPGMGHRPLGGLASLSVPWRGMSLRIEGGGFLQVNQAAGETLHEYVVREAGDVRSRRVIDAYAGAGVVGRELAGAGAHVLGIDLEPLKTFQEPRGATSLDGPTDFSDGKEMGNSLKNGERGSGEGAGGEGRFRAVRGRVEEELEDRLPADIVLLNPPRSGLDRSVPASLVRHAPGRIVYVSCDPATLARDLDRLGPGFEVERIQAFDLFPQTAHVETVVTLRAGGG
jgi:23S rRNA (uracil1939-C5)-methyltransferase